MRYSRITIYAALLLAWVAFALWQYRGSLEQTRLIEESLHQQSRSIMTALLGGMRSHRRLGRFFEEQSQGMLDELVKSEDVISVAISSSDGHVVMSAADGIASTPPASDMAATKTGSAKRWSQYSAVPFRLIESFELSPAAVGPQGGMEGGRGGGLGTGRGRGFGGRRWETEEMELAEGEFNAGGQFTAELVLDRSRADVLMRRMSWTYAVAVLAAGLVALSFALVWRATMNLAEARGQTRVNEAQMRHLRELSQAAAGLAHETRNPLGLIRGWTQRLAQAAMPEAERQKHTSALIEECDRVTARINQFLAFARPRDPEIESIDIRNMVEEMAMIMQPDLEFRQLQLVGHVAPSAGGLKADRELLRQLIFNLLQNAVQFAPAGSTIDLTVEFKSDRLAVLRVADRGPGVAVDAIESLFTPYFTTRPNGTGLGLAIVRHIATLHNWKITYHPRDGGGAVFEVSKIHVGQ